MAMSYGRGFIEIDRFFIRFQDIDFSTDEYIKLIKFCSYSISSGYNGIDWLAKSINMIIKHVRQDEYTFSIPY